MAEAGATGPSLSRNWLDSGFLDISVAHRKEILPQHTVWLIFNDRERNTRLFVDAAAELLLQTMDMEEESTLVIVNRAAQ